MSFVALLLATTVVAQAPARVQVGFLVAAVADSALGELGLEGTGVDGLAVPADHETLVKLSFRLLSLEERKLARILTAPALIAESGSSAHLEGDGARPTIIDVRASERSGTTMLDVAITAFFRTGNPASLRRA